VLLIASGFDYREIGEGGGANFELEVVGNID
jgi:hypothetical protein